MISRRGICYDLTKSHYRYKIGGLTFVFSSKLHKDNFVDRLESNREKINESLSKRFGLTVDVSMLADIVLYKRIETRGFLIESKEGISTCVSDITCESGRVTLKG